MHGRDHRSGGADPIPGAIYFDVPGQTGGFLDLFLTATDPDGYAMQVKSPQVSGGAISFIDTANTANFVSMLSTSGGGTLLDLGWGGSSGNALAAIGGGFSWDTGSTNTYGFYADVRQGGGIGFTDWGNGGTFFTDHDGNGGFSVRLGQSGTGTSTGGGFVVTDWTNSGILLATNTGNSGGNGGITFTDQGTGGVTVTTGGAFNVTSAGQTQVLASGGVGLFDIGSSGIRLQSTAGQISLITAPGNHGIGILGGYPIILSAVSGTNGTPTVQVRLDGTTNSFAVIDQAASATYFSVNASGTINAPLMPTSSAGLVSGDFWKNGTVVNVV